MSNRTPKEALREIRNRIVYMYGNIDGTFNPPALKEVCEIADDAISSPITEKSSAVGNSAAMREVLMRFLIWAQQDLWENACEGTNHRQLVNAIVNEVSAALAEPARNCDRPECATSKAAQDVWRKEDGGKTPYYEWLFAPAAERKGEGDESI